MTGGQEIICLANSRKPGGRCVAGFSLDSKRWVRPVNPDDERGTLDRRHYQPRGLGRTLLPLDVVRVPLGRACPASHQPENVFTSTGWVYVRTISAKAMLNAVGPLSTGNCELAYRGADRIGHRDLNRRPIAQSLALVRPSKVVWEVAFRGRRQVRCKFNLDARPSRLSRWQLDLPVTDPEWEKRFHGRAFGEYTMADLGVRAAGTTLLTLSLGDEYQGDCYKLVAAVIVVPVTS